jgi:DUF1680 family protein
MGFLWQGIEGTRRLMVTIPGNSTVTARLSDGLLSLRQTTGYPHENGIRFEVLASESKRERRLAVFMPPWIRPESIAVAVNGHKASWVMERQT